MFFVIIYLVTISSTKLGALDVRRPGVFTLAPPLLRVPSTYILSTNLFNKWPLFGPCPIIVPFKGQYIFLLSFYPF